MREKPTRMPRMKPMLEGILEGQRFRYLLALPLRSDLAKVFVGGLV